VVTLPERMTPPQTGAMNIFASLLEARTGQQISANRTWRIETALKPLLRARQLPSFDALVGALLTDKDHKLRDAIVDALLNQESSFYRDAHALESIVCAVAALHAGGMTRRARIWCAACSTGQEPLSLAMMFTDKARSAGFPEPEIVATDVSEAALAKARAGRYSQFEVQRGLPVRQMIEWFEPVEADWVAKPELLAKISFQRHNLVSHDLPLGRFDAILCRNVLIYLSAPLRRHVFGLIARAIRADGVLLLGAGETVMGQTDSFGPSPLYRGLYRPVLATMPLHATG
jgi:chemotaxis protein methyltransferase CheR